MQFWNAFEKLLVLRITLELGIRAPISLTLQVPRGDKLELIGSWSYRLQDFGFQDEQFEAVSSPRKVPSQFVNDLKAKLATLENIGSAVPLWLQFAAPSGSLPLIAWEAQLVPVLDRPVVRLSALQGPPPAEFEETLEVALCSSVPLSKTSFPVVEYLEKLIEVFKEVRRRTTIHVFSDLKTHQALDPKTLPDNVRLHLPQEAATYAVPARDPSIASDDAIDNPWLRWVSNATGEQPLDVVCFVNHGYLSGDHGAIAFAQSPVMNEDRGWARFIGAPQLSRFMTNTGAWCLILGSPHGNYSTAGSRMLLEEVSQRLPGHALLHDLALDQDCDGLTAACQSLFGTPRFENPPRHPSLTMYATPAKRMETETLYLPAGFESLHTDDLWEIANVIQQPAAAGPSLRDVVQQAESPRWVVAAERYLNTCRQESKRSAANLGAAGDSRNMSSVGPDLETFQQIEAIIQSYAASPTADSQDSPDDFQSPGMMSAPM
ncbi:hypothetical protein [Planctomicrobium piriforme]|uniref:CHAT domain-containing protein n=1 Tax=Planctomicrobium piriforme TaxID=1576369 RepID=A0A1I3JD50_9PLAN|nr:hypothetical protein [Planctomicrobium piriforme]SFI58173.1 hypothetical protein SAMN05421753_110136 [Planctomicrobium piriforme]